MKTTVSVKKNDRERNDRGRKNICPRDRQEESLGGKLGTMMAGNMHWWGVIYIVLLKLIMDNFVAKVLK